MPSIDPRISLEVKALGYMALACFSLDPLLHTSFFLFELSPPELANPFMLPDSAQEAPSAMLFLKPQLSSCYSLAYWVPQPGCTLSLLC
jgi:hypothetical protein